MKSLTNHELDKLACLETSHIYTASVRIRADDHWTYSFAVSHYIDGVIEANASPEANTQRERLVLRFTTGEITALGSGLERIEDKLAEGHLRGLKTVEPRHASLLKSGPIIFSLTVNRKEEV
jgi:hypothetical protein